jgi:very-short-patch-repair endonuclease
MPPELLRGPFTLAQARAAGLDRWHLEGAIWTRLGPETYVWSGLDVDPMVRLRGALCRLPAGATFCGNSAAWLHGYESDLCDLIEVNVPIAAGVVHRAGMVVHRWDLDESEVASVRGLRATSSLRTLVDVCRERSLIEAVVVLDGALHARRVRREQFTAWVESHAGQRGIRRLREAIELAEPASESPMESRLRMALVSRGLPRPKAQVSIYDSGRFVGRLDLYYESRRLGIEYDGAVHRDSMAQDNRRQNNLLRAGIRLLRFTAADVLGQPDAVAAQVRALLVA